MLRDIWAWYDANPLFFFTYNYYIYFYFVFVMLLTLFFQAVQTTFKLEEITNSFYQQLDDERKRRVAAVQTLNIADQSNVELRKKLANEEHACKSADSALESAQRQAEDQRKRLRKANDQLATSRDQTRFGLDPVWDWV